jgi:hypothetical protein
MTSLGIPHVVVSALYRVGDSLDLPRSLSLAETRVGLHAKCPLLSPDLDQNWNVSTNMAKVKLPSITCHENRRCQVSREHCVFFCD